MKKIGFKFKLNQKHDFFLQKICQRFQFFSMRELNTF
jgi:hypothetical protein